MPSQNTSRLPRARHERLLREIDLRGSIRASSMAAELGVSEVTIRRDIIGLEKEGRLARVHGGAISIGAPALPSPARTLIGLVLPGAGSHYPDVVHGATSVASAQRARLMVVSTNYRASAERRQIRRLLELGAEGIILAPTLRERSTQDLAELLEEVPVPVVLLERSFEESPALVSYDWVRTDRARGTLLAVEHLAELGHRRVAAALLDRSPATPAIREGCAHVPSRLGMDALPVRLLPKDDGGADDPADSALSSFLDDCLASGTTGVIVHTDHHAARLVEIALDRGLRVPDDLSVIADDDEFAQHGVVPLTAVAPPGREIGRTALRTLLERLRAEDSSTVPPRHIQIVPPLRQRASTGAPRPRAASTRS